MREKYGHIEEESEDEDEHEEEVEDEREKTEDEEVGHHCGKCLFIGKTEAGLKTHITVYHKS
jgi:hypothetical protein